MSHSICEMWIQNLLLGLGFKQQKPMKLHCDNEASIDTIHNPVQHDQAAHVEVLQYFI